MSSRFVFEQHASLRRDAQRLTESLLGRVGPGMVSEPLLSRLNGIHCTAGGPPEITLTYELLESHLTDASIARHPA
jgi:hypothetical protein